MIKHFMLSAALLAATTLTIKAATVEETWTVGNNSWPVEITTQELCPGVKYTLVNWKNNRSSTYPGSRLHVVEADLSNPKISVENIKTPGKMTGNKTLVNYAKQAHTSTHQVVAGANANFWITTPEKGNYACMGTQPHGVCIADGVMYTEPNVLNFAHCGGPIARTGVLAFDEDGKAYLDYFAAQTLRNFGSDENPVWSTENGPGSGFQFAAVNTRINHRLQLDMCNRWITYGCAGIFTPEYGRDKKFRVGDLFDLANGPYTENVGAPGTTGQNDGYIEILLDYVEGTDAMNVGALTDYVVAEMRYYPAGTTATIGKLGDHDLAIVGRYMFANVPGGAWKVGDKVQLDTKVNFVDHGSPEKIRQAISGNVLAMKDGVIESSVKSESYNTSNNARTLYGLNADRTKLFIVTCEHNVKNPTRYLGFSTEAVCIMARDHFGANNMTQVDCGGSAQMYANGVQVSSSYDAGGVRSVYNGLFVCYNGDDVKINEPGSTTPEQPEEKDPDEDWSDSGQRAHFAYGLSSAVGDNGLPTVTYFLTGGVKAVDIVLTNRDDDSDTVTFTGGVQKGVNTVDIDVDRLTVGGSYDWVVKVTSNAVSATSHFFHEAPATLNARGGVGVVTNPDSPAYGKIITSMGYAQGFNLYAPDLTKEGNYHAGMSPLSNDPSDFYRLAMRDKSIAYACALTDQGAGYWKFDPTAPETAPVNLIGGENEGTGCFKMPGSDNCVGSGATGIAFQGSGDDTRLWVFAKDWPTGNSSYNGILCRWDIGTAEQITSAVSAAYDQYAGTKTLANQNVCITATPDGVFCAQHRTPGNNSTGCPAFLYTDIYGTMLYNSGAYTDLYNSGGGSVAISDDLSLLAVAGRTENIKIYDVTWTDNVPAMKFRAYVNDTKHVNEVSQLAFDPAGNLYAWQRSTSGDYAGLFGYSWKNDNPVATTPAASGYVIVARDSSGIDDVVSDNDSDATAVYYTVQGVRVDAANLVPGLYIKVVNNKSEKILIK